MKGKNILRLFLFSTVSIMAYELGMAQSQDTLEVTINRPPNGSQVHEFRQSPAYPNLSIISVLDENGQHTSGLASKERWLGPSDTAENGMPISQIWQPLREFQGSEDSSSVDPDLYAHIPAPQIREVCGTCEPNVPTSITLLMDMSSSLRDDHLLLAKQGLINFVNKMNEGDRAGVIQFASTDSLLPTLPMTGDKSAIIDFVNSASRRDWTPLYLALRQGIEQIQVETNTRRCIVIYTDGRNALPGNPVNTFTPDSVIVNAQKHNIPVFTIALGKNTNETALKRIAIQTGGRFFKTVDGTEFNAIYDQISELVRNYYVLAYTSPDPCSPDGTRFLDVTVNTLTGTGNSRLAYSYTGPSKEYDLAVELTSQVSTDELCIGDEITYSLTISNNGPHTAFDVSIENRVSTFLTDVVYSYQPTLHSFGTALWRLDSLGASQAMTIAFTARVGSNVRSDLAEIVNESRVSAPCDINPDNNLAIDTVYYDPSVCLPDLSINLSVQTDSLVVQGADSLWFAQQGETYPCFITVNNESRFHAVDVRVNSLLPDSVKVGNGPGQKTLAWDLGDLEPRAARIISFDATVAGFMPEGINRLVHSVSVQAANEDPSSLANNAAVNTVYNYIEPRLSDLSVHVMAHTDSFSVMHGDTLWFAAESETFPYFIRISNRSKYPAENAVLTSVLPDSITSSNFSSGDPIRWHFDRFPAFGDTTFRIDATVSKRMPEGFNRLIHSVSVRAANEDPASLANNADVDTVYNYIEPRLSDLAVQVTARTDSFATMQGDTLWFAAQGETFIYFIRISNHSKYPAENTVLASVLPDSIASGNFSSEDPIRWHFDRFPAFGDTTFRIDATVSKKMPEGTNLLINSATVRSENENPLRLSDNSDEKTVYNYVEPRWSDIAVLSTVETDSFTVQGADTVWLARAGESYSYSITVHNDAKYVAENVIITSIFPDLLSLDHPNGGNTAEWRLGDLAPRSITSFSYNATLHTELGPTVVELLTLVEARSDNEDPGKLHNNFHENIVFTVPPDEGCGLFYLDYNVYRPGAGVPLGINFEINSSRNVRLDLYDVSGYHVTKLTESGYLTGEHRFEWQGETLDGRKVGSGVYVITLRSGSMVCWKKVIVAR